MRTLYFNGVVVTMDPGCPQVEALVTEENRILGIGSLKQMTDLAGSSRIEIDMQGGALYPGFNETHNHLSIYAIFRQYAYLGEESCISELLETLIKHGKKQPLRSATPMIIGFAYDDTNLADNRQLTRHDLDKVSTEVPVLVFHISMHLGFLNSKALEFFGITESSVAEEGGVIHRDEQGFPTGRLDEMSWFSTMAKIEAPDKTLYRALLKEAVAEFNESGFTGIHDAGIGLDGMPQTVVQTYRDLANDKELNLRVFASATHEVYESIEYHENENMVDDYFVLGGVKLFLDGSIQAATAALQEPYSHDSALQGELILPTDLFSELVEKYHANGTHISVHGNGDLAIETVIAAFEKAQKISPRPGSRHMLIHAQMAHPDHILRMKTTNIIPSFFGMHVYNWGDRHRDIFIGEKRAKRLDPAGEAERIGLAFTLHVDTPVLLPQAILSIHTAVNRLTKQGYVLGKENCITPHSAVGAYTSMAALCSNSEDVRGTIAPGKLADLTLLSKDVITCPPEEIATTEVLRTVVGGKTVYDRSAKNVL